MRIGFTGTSEGMLAHQRSTVRELMLQLIARKKLLPEGHHGLCIGADAQFNDLCDELAVYTVGYPGVTKSGKPYKRATVLVCHTYPEKQFLKRNRDIVAAVDVMIATPRQFDEQWMGSGTWATIRYARKMKKELYIVWPDGTVTEEK